MSRILLVCLLLCSCATKQVECDSYSEFIVTDTLCIESQHVHLEQEHQCVYFDDIEIIATDTIRIKLPKQIK